MKHIYITSTDHRAGRTAFSASLTALLRARGDRATYVKPVSVSADDGDDESNEIGFLKEALGLPQPVSEIACVTADVTELEEGLGGRKKAVKDGLKVMAQEADTLVIDGLPATGLTAAASAEIAEMTKAQVVCVVSYCRGMDIADIVTAKQHFGGRFVGVVLNSVSALSMRAARQETIPALEQMGVETLGVVPEERMLLGFTVADYRKRLGGRLLNNEEHAGKIIENLIVGAMALDESTYYYERKDNKALITRGDRPDLQWNALESSTRCLILTQDQDPIPYVMDKAEDAEVPVVVVPKGTLDTVAEIEDFVTEPNFHHPEKLARYTHLLGQALDLGTLGL